MFKSRAGRTGQNGYWLSLSLWKWLWWDAVPNGCSFDGSSFKEGCSRDLTVLPAQDYSISWGWPLLPFVPWWSGYLVLIWGPLGSRCLVASTWTQKPSPANVGGYMGFTRAWGSLESWVSRQSESRTYLRGNSMGVKELKVLYGFFFSRLILLLSFFPFPLPFSLPLLPTPPPPHCSPSSSSLFLNVSY